MTHYLIRPDGAGVRASLFELEADIMEVVWAHDWDGFAVSDVHEALLAEREIAYTTVMTTVSRLYDKGILDRQKDGRRYLYRPLFTRESFLRALTREVFERLPASSQDEAIAFLVERVEEAGSDELDRLEALIARRRSEIGEEDE